MATTLTLGNTAVVQTRRDDNDELVRQRKPSLGNQVTAMSFPDDMTFADRLRAVESAWPWHSDDPPEWVESDDDMLARAVSENFDCQIGRPDGWKEGK